MSGRQILKLVLPIGAGAILLVVAANFFKPHRMQSHVPFRTNTGLTELAESEAPPAPVLRMTAPDLLVGPAAEVAGLPGSETASSETTDAAKGTPQQVSLRQVSFGEDLSPAYLAQHKEDWPSPVYLRVPVDFPAVSRGRVTGKTTALPGTAVLLDSITPTGARIEYATSSIVVPLEITDVRERILSLRADRRMARVSSVGGVSPHLVEIPETMTTVSINSESISRAPAPDINTDSNFDEADSSSVPAKNHGSATYARGDTKTTRIRTRGR